MNTFIMIHNFFQKDFVPVIPQIHGIKTNFTPFVEKNLLFERLINENNFVQIWLININDKNFNRNKNKEHIST